MALALLNNRQELYRCLREALESRGVNHKPLHDSRLLALAHNLEYQPLVQNHTLVPYHRAVVGAQNGNMKSAHGLPFYYNSFPIRQLARQGAWFCPECATEDRAIRGLSYWRRFHQLPGVVWCEFHERTKLRRVESETAFKQQPHHLIGRSSPADGRCQASPEEWDVIQKFTRICLGLLEIVYPMPREAALGITAGNRKMESPELLTKLSQLARTTFFSDWLKFNFPDLMVNAMDENGRKAFPLSSTSHFALALALLFDSSEEALGQWLHRQEIFFSSKQNKPGASSYLGLYVKFDR
jgi:hypothetical protein